MKEIAIATFAALVIVAACTGVVIVTTVVVDDHNAPALERKCHVEAYDACVKNTSDPTDCLRQMRAVCDVERAQ